MSKVVSQHLVTLFRYHTDPNTTNDWGPGIPTLLRKNGKRNQRKNYRPITFLSAVYKIRAALMTNRLSPILNISTKDNQCAYKAGMSTMGAIWYTDRQFIKNVITGHIAFGLSKAIGVINRYKLRRILYGEERPVKVIKDIMKDHGNNIIQGNITV